ncbi:MAG TPA: hypothetical protein VES38_02955 [Methylotenera sp.]|nr:hypothetical protein [Methylotenera sp.]
MKQERIEKLLELSVKLSLAIEDILQVKEAKQQDLDNMHPTLQKGQPGIKLQSYIYQLEQAELGIQAAINAIDS